MRKTCATPLPLVVVKLDYLPDAGGQVAVDVLWLVAVYQVNAAAGVFIAGKQRKVLDAVAAAIEANRQVRYKALPGVLPRARQLPASCNVSKGLIDVAPVVELTTGLQRWL